MTGAAGLLGANLVHAWREAYDLHGTIWRAEYRPPGCEVHRVDLADATDVQALLEEIRPHVVVHTAAATNVDWCEDHASEAARANVDATLNLCDAALRVGARMVQISTDSVFDGRTGQYDEEAQPNPINVYSRTKLEAEAHVRKAPGSLITRCCIYGWNAQPKESLAEWALGKLERRERINGFQDAFFTPISANDLAAVLHESIQAMLTGLYNIGSPDRMSKFDFCRLIANETGGDSRLIVPAWLDKAGLRAPRPKDTSLASGKIEKALGFRMPTVENGLRRFLELGSTGYRDALRQGIAPAEAVGRSPP